VSHRLAECCCIAQTGEGGCDVCPTWPSAFSALIQISGQFNIQGTLVSFNLSGSTVMEIDRCPDGSGDRCAFASRVQMSHPLYEPLSCNLLSFKGALPTATTDSGLVTTFPGYQQLQGVVIFGCALLGQRVSSRQTYDLVVVSGFYDERVVPGSSFSTRQFLTTGNAADNDASVSISCVFADTERLDSNDIYGNCWHSNQFFAPATGTVCTSVDLKDPCQVPNGLYRGTDVNGWTYAVIIS